MNAIGIHDWTLGAAWVEHADENRKELLEATLRVMHAYGNELKTVEWFGSNVQQQDAQEYSSAA